MYEKQTEKSIQELWDGIKSSNIHVTWTPEEEEK